jgi:hypothetical protein
VRKPATLGLLLLGGLFVSQLASAQEYPFSGQIYLSFDPDARVATRDVAPGETFQLWLIADIPVFPADPGVGIAGVEGSIAFPPSLEVFSLLFVPGSIDLGPGIPEPDRVNFIVGLGACHTLGGPDVLGVASAQLLEGASNLEISVTAPSVGAASISSFGGDGPGWAAFRCEPFESAGLYLFERPTPVTSSIIVNPTPVSTRLTSFSRVKALY